MSSSELLLGVDVGTTTLSLTLVDANSAASVYSMTLINDSAMPSAHRSGIQDAVRIADLTLDAVDSLLDAFPGVAAIGVTGQMHGIICLDHAGEAVSPLYTWQDQRADSMLCDEIFQRTGRRIYPGYGHATLYALAKDGELHGSAQQYCTVMDYIVMHLTGRKFPIMHSTNAAALGLYDLRGGCFDEAALRTLALPLSPPAVTGLSRVVGDHNGIPVSIAIGDNQAAFFGSVPDEVHSLLLNYGTGSQLSLVCDSPDMSGGEIRPYLDGKYLLSRSALCGGRAYAMLERFFAAYSAQAGYGGEPQYETLNALAEQAYRAGQRLRVSTQFCGTRENPSLRGGIQNIGEDNFTPGALALGVLQGMVDELHDGFDASAHTQIRRLIASGNAVRKNPMLRTLLSDTFSMPLYLTREKEEAAHGAALFSGVCAGIIPRQSAKTMIRLEPA